MAHHPGTVEGWNGSLHELAMAIGNMRYDTQADFIQLLTEEFERQSRADHDSGRNQLSARLDHVAAHLDWARVDLMMAWRICEPFMEDTT
jgi:hypothetical protein